MSAFGTLRGTKDLRPEKCCFAGTGSEDRFAWAFGEAQCLSENVLLFLLVAAFISLFVMDRRFPALEPLKADREGNLSV